MAFVSGRDTPIWQSTIYTAVYYLHCCLLSALQSTICTAFYYMLSAVYYLLSTICSNTVVYYLHWHCCLLSPLLSTICSAVYYLQCTTVPAVIWRARPRNTDYWGPIYWLRLAGDIPATGQNRILMINSDWEHQSVEFRSNPALAWRAKKYFHLQSK